jgi:hypothetical protein
MRMLCVSSCAWDENPDEATKSVSCHRHHSEAPLSVSLAKQDGEKKISQHQAGAGKVEEVPQPKLEGEELLDAIKKQVMCVTYVFSMCNNIFKRQCMGFFLVR